MTIFPPSGENRDYTRLPEEHLDQYISRVFKTQTNFAKAIGRSASEVNRFLKRIDSFGEARRTGIYNQIQATLGVDFRPSTSISEQSQALYHITHSNAFELKRTSSYRGTNAMYEPFFFQGRQTVAPIYTIWHKLFNEMRGICSIEAFTLTPYFGDADSDFVIPHTADYFLQRLNQQPFTVLSPAGSVGCGESRYGREVKHHNGELAAIIVRASELTNNPYDNMRYLALTITPSSTYPMRDLATTASTHFLEHLSKHNYLKTPLSKDGESTNIGFLHEWDSFASDQFGYYSKMVGEHMINLNKNWEWIEREKRRTRVEYKQRK